jgi:alkylated DNA repair dioxygenase AlkB
MYTTGAGIGWHRDAPAFGPTVVGISLGSEEVMRFRRQVGDHFEMYKQPLERRSIYVLGGSSRSYWQHSLPPAKQLRYSITFRTVKEKYKAPPENQMPLE